MDGLVSLIDRRATSGPCFAPAELGVAFHRITEPMTCTKVTAAGPSLTVVARGTKRARFGDLELEYDPARCIVITGETTFASRVEATPAAPFLAATIALPVDAIVALAAELPAPRTDDDTEPAPAYTAPFDATLRDVVARYFATLDEPTERRVLAPRICEELIFRLLRSDAAAGVRAPLARDATPIRAAMAYMRAHAAKALSVEQVAKHVAMSPSHFAHRFRAVARVTPMRYLKQVRLEQARARLGDGLRVAEVAGRVGYESASHFSRDFKQAFGLAPAEFARRIAGTAGSGTPSTATGMAAIAARP